MVSPLKGLTMAIIHARALARQAEKAAKKRTKKKKGTTRKTTAPSSRVRVSQATVTKVKNLGRTAARAAAAKPGASAEFKEAVRRIYPDRKKR